MDDRTLAEVEMELAQAVTGMNSEQIAAIQKRNAERDPEQEERKRRFWRACKMGGICGSCGRELGPGEGVIYTRLFWGYGRFTGQAVYHEVPVSPECCEQAIHPYTRVNAMVRPCQTCKRPAGYDTSWMYLRKWWFCCERCEWTHYNGVVKSRADIRRMRVCPVCGKHFQGSRKDAVTCSPACRQKAYRQRKVSG